jgi:hypothetical protein
MVLGWTRRKAMTVRQTGPPSDEQGSAALGNRANGFGRKLVSRQTLLAAIRLIVMVTRLAELLQRVFGNL